MSRTLRPYLTACFRASSVEDVPTLVKHISELGGEYIEVAECLDGEYKMYYDGWQPTEIEGDEDKEDDDHD